MNWGMDGAAVGDRFWSLLAILGDAAAQLNLLKTSRCWNRWLAVRLCGDK